MPSKRKQVTTIETSASTFGTYWRYKPTGGASGKSR